tara:strand:+ start:354 stop:1205 length:852 start_codon:yes stop_codon:yes gene_type:complete
MTVHFIYRVIAILFFLLILNSCSKTRLLYNNADLFLLNQFDIYFDLNDTQRSNLKISITKFLDWHRKSELDLLAVRLKQLKLRYKRGIREEDFNWIFEQYDIFRKRILYKIEPDLAAFFLTLEENQIRHMEKKILERDDWLTKQNSMTDDEAYEETFQWFCDSLENWLGDLKSDQRDKIASWLRIDRNWIVIQLENRIKKQNLFGRLLRSKENISEGLHKILHQPEAYWIHSFKEKAEDKKKEWKTILLQVDAITLPTQRENAANELQRYIDDFLFLSQENAS